MSEHEKSKAVKKEIKRVTARVDVMPIIKSVRDGSFKPTFDGPALAATKLPIWDAQRVWTQFRGEEIALESIFIGEILPRYLKARETWATKAFSLAASTPLNDHALAELQGGTQTLFSGAIDSWKDERERRLASTLVTKDPLDEAFRYYKDMVTFGAQNGIGLYNDSLSSWIERGWGTANSVVWGLVQLVPDLAKEKGYTLTHDQIVEAIKTGYGPLITVFMSMNTQVATPLLEGIMESSDWSETEDDPRGVPFVPFKKEFFDLVPEGDGYKLVFHHEKLKEIKGKSGKPVIESDLTIGTYWCPVRHTEKDTGVDVMQTFFDLAMEDARKYYFSRLSTP